MATQKNRNASKRQNKEELQHMKKPMKTMLHNARMATKLRNSR
jgi:hypothetical protein